MRPLIPRLHCVSPKAQSAREVDECGELLAEKRNSYLRVMLTAPEKKASDGEHRDLDCSRRCFRDYFVLLL